MKSSRLLVFSTVALALALSGCSPGSFPAQKANASRGGAKQSSNDGALQRVQKARTLLWGADVVGGVPYVYEDKAHPGTYIGFEMEIAQGVARELGVEAKLVVRAWDTLVPELQRGSFDMAMNGIEDTPERAKIVRFSDPYYVYSQQLTVRRDDASAKGLSDMTGKKVATLSGSAAEDILRGIPGINVVVEPEITYSYQALADGKVDAVLLDTPIAAAYGATNPELKNVGDSMGEGHYVIAFRQDDGSLQEAVNRALDTMRKDGTLKAIYAKYGIMDPHQTKIGIE